MSYHYQKRILDILVAVTLSLLFFPFWIFVPIFIFFDSGLPIMFKHRRVGHKGKEFFMYKFRSMRPDADEYLHKHNPELLEEFKKGDWKIENDPRITQLGKVLRSFTIDEFPQLFNVLIGDMSMVGPRAYVKKELQEQTKKYPSTRKLLPKILAVKPGITGLWQTTGRNEIPFTKRAELDAQYAEHASIWGDLKIILKTPKAMISKW